MSIINFVFLYLLRLKVSAVGGVAPLVVAVVAFDLLVVLGFLNHHDLQYNSIIMNKF